MPGRFFLIDPFPAWVGFPEASSNPFGPWGWREGKPGVSARAVTAQKDLPVRAKM